MVDYVPIDYDPFAGEKTADDMIVRARYALADQLRRRYIDDQPQPQPQPQPQTAPGWSGIGAAMPESYGASAPIMDPLANGLISFVTLPKRAIDAAARDVQNRGDTSAARPDYMSGPAVESALLTMGGGVGGIEGEGAALGSGPARMRMVDNVDLYRELANQRRARGWSTGKSAEGWDFTRPDAAKGSWDRAVAEARANFAGDAHQAQLGYGHVAPGNPLMSAADWAFIDDNIRRGNPTLGAGATDAKGAAAIQGIRAYHGSPYDFDKFDISKIGTGEGAQAYGHGLYFAENPAVAETYKNMERMPGLGEKLDPYWSPGKMYEVGINANPEHFLDWDKPLFQQSDHVRSALDSLGVSTAPQGEWSVKPTDSVATQSLRDAGIPGIKYLDQGSRGAGEGSRNYVVFDDSLIDIIRKYGWAGLAALPPATASILQNHLAPVEYDPFALHS